MGVILLSRGPKRALGAIQGDLCPLCYHAMAPLLVLVLSKGRLLGKGGAGGPIQGALAGVRTGRPRQIRKMGVIQISRGLNRDLSAIQGDLCPLCHHAMTPLSVLMLGKGHLLI